MNNFLMLVAFVNAQQLRSRYLTITASRITTLIIINASLEQFLNAAGGFRQRTIKI
jgi:hypothetical protein